MTTLIGTEQSTSGSSPRVERYAPQRPVSLIDTLGVLGRGPFDPTHQWVDGALWRTFRTPIGAVTLRLRTERDAIRAEAWGPGSAWVIDGLPILLGERDDWSGFDDARHPLVRDSARRHPGLRLTRTRLVFEAITPAIVEQRVPSIEAYRSWARLVRRFGDRAPGPAPDGMRVMPTPHEWRRIPSWEWHRAGVDPNRSRTVLRAAVVADSLQRSLDDTFSSNEVEKMLTSIQGVGHWTFAETVQRSHGDPDVVSVGDYHLSHFVGSALTGSRVDDDGMLELLEPWAGHRNRVIRLLLASGHRAPRFGSRVPIQDHRWH